MSEHSPELLRQQRYEELKSKGFVDRVIASRQTGRAEWYIKRGAPDKDDKPVFVKGSIVALFDEGAKSFLVAWSDSDNPKDASKISRMLHKKVDIIDLFDWQIEAEQLHKNEDETPTIEDDTTIVD